MSTALAQIGPTDLPSVFGNANACPAESICTGPWLPLGTNTPSIIEKYGVR